jgi:1,2-phenylacetyl-CoA epoxidase PaaB subunit
MAIDEQAITRAIEAYARRQEAMWIRLFNALTKEEQKVASKRMSSKASGALYNYAGRQIDENCQTLRHDSNAFRTYQRKKDAGG